MRRRYITFISLLVVAMFSIMPLSQLSSSSIALDSNSPGKINPSLSNRLLGEVVNTWHVSGKTCVPSSASIESAITLKIDVTSFSESSGAGDTPLYFIVSGVNVHTDYIGGTGVYAYTWDVNSMPGNINFHAEYLSGSEFYSMHSMAPKPSVFFRNSYSTFGNSNIHVEKYIDEMGYDGNNTIYLSYGNYGFYKVYNTKQVGESSNTYTGRSLLTSNNNSIEGITAYGNTCNDGKLQINLNLTSISEGNYYVTPNGEYSGLWKEYIDVNTNAPSDIAQGITNQIQTAQNNGFNISTNANNRGTAVSKDVCSLMLDGLSLIPVAGYAATAISAARTSANLISTVSSANNPSGTTDNNVAGIEYCFDSNHVLYGAGTEDQIQIPAGDLKQGFTITVTYFDEYMCDGSLVPIKSASTTQTLTTVTSSAIYGCVEHNDEPVNLTNKALNLYIKNVNNGNFYKVPIKNGNYLFFAKPDTEYNIYYHTNNNFKLLKTINASDLSAGSSFKYNIHYSDIND